MHGAMHGMPAGRHCTPELNHFSQPSRLESAGTVSAKVSAIAVGVLSTIGALISSELATFNAVWLLPAVGLGAVAIMCFVFSLESGRGARHGYTEVSTVHNARWRPSYDHTIVYNDPAPVIHHRHLPAPVVRPIIEAPMRPPIRHRPLVTAVPRAPVGRHVTPTYAPTPRAPVQERRPFNTATTGGRPARETVGRKR